MIARNVNPGAEVQGQYSGGTAVELFTVGELDSVWVFADVFEMDLARVQEGRAGQRSRSSPIPTRCSPARSTGSPTRSIRPRARRASAARSPTRARELKPEMYATVTIAVAGASGAGAAARRAAAPRRPDGGVRRDGQRARRPAALRAAPVVAVDEDEGTDYVPIAHGVEPRRPGRDLGRDPAVRNALRRADDSSGSSASSCGCRPSC